MKKFCLRANYLALFKRTSISKKELQINESNIACCPITLFARLVELWKGENLNKVTLGNSYWTRESQYDIGVGSTNETKKFLMVMVSDKVLVIRSPRGEELLLYFTFKGQ